MTALRTTCTDCGTTADLSADRTLLELPAVTADRDADPHLLHSCPGCGAAHVTAVSWRLASYLSLAGASTSIAPDDDEVRPDYPERRPLVAGPMTLDDLIALHDALDAPVASL